MGALAFIAGVTAIALLVVWGRPWLRGRKRSRLRRRPLPPEAIKILERNVGLYRFLPDDLKAKLHGHINVFLDEKRFTGCDGLTISNEVSVTIAGIACLLLMNRPATYFPGFSSILVYPGSYRTTQVSYDGQLEVQHESHRAGEAWHRGPVVLSWNDTLNGAANVGDGYNVVLHEFAHKLDEENAGTNGSPILEDRNQYATWATVLSEEFEALGKRVATGKNDVIDDYGLTSPAEFFAVATESFFEKPAAMKRRLPALYDQLKRFYGLRPVEWFT